MFGKLVPQGRYARNVITLMTGTIIAQAIPIAASPILTRLYSPAEFGMFALYMATASIAAVAVTGRYEFAILLPKRDRDALHIVALVAVLSTCVSAAFLVLLIAFRRPAAELLGSSMPVNWLYWVPASTFLTGLYQSLNYWCNRKSQYKRVSINRAAQSGSASLAQLGGGCVGAGTMGLVGGQLLGQGMSTAVLALAVTRDELRSIRRLDKRRMTVLAKRYRNFPKFLIAAHGFNTASSQLPVIFLNALFNASSAGFYTLTQRVLGAPMSLVAATIGDVFRQEASYAYVHNGECREIYRKTFKRLLLFSFLPFFLFFLLAPQLFAWVFGESWRVAGEYARILTPMFFFQFITSPLSVMFMIAQKQKLDLVWQVLLVSLTSASFIFGHLFNSIELSLTLFASSYSVMYAVSGLMTYQFAKNNDKR